MDDTANSIQYQPSSNTNFESEVPTTDSTNNASNAMGLLNNYIESTEQRKIHLGVHGQDFTSRQAMLDENSLLKAQVSKLKSELLKYVQLSDLNKIMNDIQLPPARSGSTRGLMSPAFNPISPSAIVPPRSSERKRREPKGIPNLNSDTTDDESISSSIQLSPDKSILHEHLSPSYKTQSDLSKTFTSPIPSRFEIQAPSENIVRTSFEIPESSGFIMPENNLDDPNSKSKPATCAAYTSSRIHIIGSPKVNDLSHARQDTSAGTVPPMLTSNSTPTRLKIVEDLAKCMAPGSATSSQYTDSNNNTDNLSTEKPDIVFSSDESPIRANRLASVVGDELHSPMRPPISVAGIKEELEEFNHENLLYNDIPDLTHHSDDVSSFNTEKNIEITKPYSRPFLQDSSKDAGSDDQSSVTASESRAQELQYEDQSNASIDFSIMDTPQKADKKGKLVSLSQDSSKEDILLGSPILFNKFQQQEVLQNSTVQRSSSSLAEKRSMGLDQSSNRSLTRQVLAGKPPSNMSSATKNISDSVSINSLSPFLQDSNSKFSQTVGPLQNAGVPAQPQLQQPQQTSFTPTSSASVQSPNLMSPKGNQVLKSNIPLFVQPDEFHTIKIQVLGTLYHNLKINGDLFGNSESSRIISSTDNNEFCSRVLFGVFDRNSNKKIFEFSKDIDQIYELNEKHLVPYLNLFTLPPLPEKSFFQSSIPSKVNQRKEKLTDYFLSLFNIPEVPGICLLRLAEFISTNTVTSGMGLVADNGLLESWVLMRKSKTIGSSSTWKERYAVLGHDGRSVKLYDTHSNLIEHIKLANASIEILPNIPEDKYGTSNGIQLLEPKKSGISSVNKYCICFESAKTRETWVSLLSRLTFVPGIPKSASSRKLNLNKSSTFTSTLDDISSNTSYGANSENGMENTSHDGTSSLMSDEASSNKSALLNSVVGDQISSNSSNNNNTSIMNGQMGTSNTGPMSDREIKRNRMRSFFPFKKSSNHTNSSSIDESSMSPRLQQHSSMDSNNYVTDLENDQQSGSTIAKTLAMMNLDPPLSNLTIFGNSLPEALNLSSQTYQKIHVIPSLVYRCLEHLYKNQAIEEEGIFRLSGSSAVIKNLQEQFDTKYDIDLCNYAELNVDMNVVTGLLKLYLRSLPHFIFGDENFDRFKLVVEQHAKDEKNIALQYKEICQTHVAKENYDLMYVLFELLYNISKKSEVNKMNLRNLCIVFSPTLNVTVNMLQPFIVDFSCIFRNKEPLETSQRETLDIHIPTVG